MASTELAPIVEMLRSVQPREGVPLDIAQLRMFLASMVAPPPRGVSVRPFELGGRRAEWLVPEGADAGSRLLYLHGGAYVAGSVDSHRALAGRIARASGCVALVVDYRLAPESPFPAALDDALAALRHAAERGPDGGARAAGSLFVAGDSAGGGLALSTLLAARGRLPVTAGVTLSAWTDLAGTGASFATRREADPFLVPHLVKPAAAAYLAGHDPLDPRVSPLYGELAGLPPLLMHVGDAEILLDDTLRFADKARAAGVDVTHEVWPEMIHVWHAFAAVLSEGRAAIERIGTFLRERAAR